MTAAANTMNLKGALGIAGQYATPKSLNNFSHVVLSKGFVRASDGNSGVEVPCPEVDVEAAVDCAALQKMVAAIGTVRLSVGKGKEKNRIVIEGGGSRFTLQMLQTEQIPIMRPSPKDATWQEMNDHQTAALVTVAGLAGSADTANFALSGLRLTPGWCACATTAYLGVAWAAGIVEEAVTAPASLFDGVAGTAHIFVEDGRVWLREERTGQIRWASQLTAEWPDESVNQILAEARGDTGGRVTFEVDLGELATVARQADVVADPGSAFKLTGTTGLLAMEGAGTGAKADFKGTVKALGDTGSPIVVGVSPTHMAKVADAVQAVHGARRFISMASDKAVVMWGDGEVVVEGLCMAKRL